MEKAVYEKINEFLGRVRERFPRKTPEEIRLMCGHLANYVEWKKKKKPKVRLTSEEVALQRLLLQHKYKAGTCYRWLIIYTSAYKEIKELVKQRKLSLRRAGHEIANRKLTQGVFYASKPRLHYAVYELLNEWIHNWIGTPLGDMNVDDAKTKIFVKNKNVKSRKGRKGKKTKFNAVGQNLQFHIPDKRIILTFAKACKDSSLLMLYALQTFLGLRIGSALNLRWMHVDFEKKGAFVTDDKYTKRNKIGYGKDRIVPIMDRFIPILKLWKCLNKNEEYVIPRRGKINNEKSWVRKFEELYTDTYELIGKKIVWRDYGNGYKRYIFNSHSCRHVFASNLILHRENVVTVSKLLGHANLEQTMVYVHLCDEMKKRAVNKPFEQPTQQQQFQVVLQVQPEQLPQITHLLANQQKVMVMTNGSLSQ